MTGSSVGTTALAALQGQLGHDAADHVAHVGHALAQVLVLDLREQLGVLVERLVQGGGGIDVAIEDGRLDLADEGGVAEQQAMGAEDGGLVLADLLRDAGDDGVEFLGGGGAGPVEPADLAGQGGFVQL